MFKGGNTMEVPKSQPERLLHVKARTELLQYLIIDNPLKKCIAMSPYEAWLVRINVSEEIALTEKFQSINEEWWMMIENHY